MKLTAEQIKTLVAEITAVDSLWRDRASELAAIIERLAAAKPEAVYDRAFRERLRSEITRPAGQDRGRGFENSVLKINNAYRENLIAAAAKYMNNNNVKKLAYAAAGAAVLILIIAPSLVLWLEKTTPQFARRIKSGKKIALQTTIKKTAERAFGPLANAPAVQTAEKAAAPAGLGGGNVTMGQGSAGGIAFGRGGGGGAQADAKIGIMPPYEFKSYKFVYRGAEITAPEATQPVLKRIKGAAVSVNMPDLVAGLNFGALDLSGFSDLNIQSVTLQQKTDFGYLINIFPDEGSVGISQYWEFWPPGKCGGDQACFERERVKADDLPTDDQAIAIADSFLAEHNIDRTSYGKPEVQSNWHGLYEASTDKANFYFPDTIDVVYPLLINGKAVYDEYNGQKQGITVQVHLKTKKVAGLWNLTTQNYESSDYAMETDAKKLIGYAEQGGVNNVYYFAPGAKETELELGDPEPGYIRSYNYRDGKNSELLVPALVFPIKNLPADDPNFFRKTVVVPLATEILSERLGQAGGNPGMPQPLGEPALKSDITPPPVENKLK